jgi:circadian clock protein KaiB
MKSRKTSSTKEFETALEKLKDDFYVFKLYVAGSSPHSLNAIKNLKLICERYLKGRYELNIFDIHQQPAKEELLAAPTLIKKLPLPVKRLIGDMSDLPSVLLALNIKSTDSLA